MKSNIYNIREYVEIHSTLGNDRRKKNTLQKRGFTLLIGTKTDKKSLKKIPKQT